MERVKLQEALTNSKYILDEMQRWAYAGQDEGNIELDIGTPHGEASNPDNLDFCHRVASSVSMLGDIRHNDTENFIYPLPICSQGGDMCYAWIIRRNGDYMLMFGKGSLVSFKSCATFGNDTGSYICRYLESQGWEYAESVTPWGIPDM